MPRKNASATTTGPTATTNGDTSILSQTAEPKSPARTTVVSGGGSGAAGGGRQSTASRNDEATGIDDLLLPRSLTSRLARGVLPANTSIHKDATLALAKSATVFISYLASHANEQTSKKTIGPQDVLNALKEIEMSQVMGLGQVGSDGRIGGRLERELEMFENAVATKRKGYREKVKARESVGGETGGGSTENGGDEDREERGEPRAKKARRMSEDEVLLDAQLNGRDQAENPSSSSPQQQHQQRKRPNGIDSLINHDPEPNPNQDEDGNDETEDDPEIEDQDQDEDQDDNEDSDDEEEEEEEEFDYGFGNGENEEDRIESYPDTERNRPALAPNGRVEIGSEDESD